MFGFIKKILIVLLSGLTNASIHTIYVSLCNQKYEIQPTFVNLHPAFKNTFKNYTTIYLQLN